MKKILIGIKKNIHKNKETATGAGALLVLYKLRTFPYFLSFLFYYTIYFIQFQPLFFQKKNRKLFLRFLFFYLILIYLFLYQYIFNLI